MNGHCETCDGTDPLTTVRNQLQTAIEKIAWIEQARSKTLPADHLLTVDMTVETVRYLSNLVNSFSDNEEVLAEQHINRRLTRTVIEVQGERDALRARAEAAERDGLAAVEEVRRLVRSITEGNICRLCEMIYGHHDPTCPVIHAATEPPAAPAADEAGGEP